MGDTLVIAVAYGNVLQVIVYVERKRVAVGSGRVYFYNAGTYAFGMVVQNFLYAFFLVLVKALRL